MTRRRKRPNFFMWVVFGLVLLFGYYFNQVYLPAQPNPFDATPTPTRSWESFSTEAQELFAQGKLSQAIEAYESAIASSPQDPTLYIALARVQVLAGLPKEAQSNAENAILLSPNNALAHAVRAWALDFQGSDKNGEALEAIEKAIELDPESALAHAYYTEILIDSNLFENYDNAAEHSKTALALDPNLLETRRARGYLLSTLGAEGNNYELAVEEYKAAIDINPNIPILHMELGQNLRLLQVYDDAIKEFTLANTLNPIDPEPDYFISRTYATIGEYEKALQYAESAVTDRPNDPRYRGNYGVIFYLNFYYTDAVRELGLAVNGGTTEDGFPIQGMPLSDEPRVAEYYFTYGWALARTNQCGEALPLAQTLQTKFPVDDGVIEAANAIITICQENLENPVVETSTAIEEAAGEATSTPEPELEVTATP